MMVFGASLTVDRLCLKQRFVLKLKVIKRLSGEDLARKTEFKKTFAFKRQEKDPFLMVFVCGNFL